VFTLKILDLFDSKKIEVNIGFFLSSFLSLAVLSYEIAVVKVFMKEIQEQGIPRVAGNGHNAFWT
jgi:hypothetical protein